MAKKIKHWEVYYIKKELTAFLSSATCPDLICSSEPKRINDYYELQFIDGGTKHIMADSLNSISWVPIYEDDNTSSDNQKDS